MGQGSINSYQAPRAPIEGIATALKAIHEAYGINTEEAQQKILALDAKAKEADLPLKKAKADAEMTFLNGFNNQSQNSGQQPINGGAPKKLGMMDYAKKTLDSGGYVPESQLAMMAGIQKFKNEQTEGALKEGQLSAQPGEIRTKKMEPIVAGTNKFNETTKENKANVASYEDVYKGINSGNIEQEQAALAKLPMVQLGIKRMNESTAATAESQKLADQLQSQLSIAKTGHQSQKTKDIVSRAALISKTNELSTLDGLANDAAGQLASTGAHGLSADEIKNKHLLPGNKYTSDVLQYANSHGLSADDALKIKAQRSGK